MVFFPRLTHNMQIMRDKTAVSKNGTIQQKAANVLKESGRPPSVPFPGLGKCSASVRDPGGRRFGGEGGRWPWGKFSSVTRPFRCSGTLAALAAGEAIRGFF